MSRATNKVQRVAQAADAGRGFFLNACLATGNGTIVLHRKTVQEKLQRGRDYRGQNWALTKTDWYQVFQEMAGFQDLLWVHTDKVYVMAALFHVRRLRCEVCAVEVPVYFGGFSNVWGMGSSAGVRRVVTCDASCAGALKALATISGWEHRPYDGVANDGVAATQGETYTYMSDLETLAVPPESRLAWSEPGWRSAPLYPGSVLV